MPKNPDYQKSLIYKIEHLNKPELCYVGSTSNFVKRKYNHKKDCNNENNNQLKYRTMRENGGWESFIMVVIKEYPCNTRTELDIEEEKCRKELQASLNSNRCHRTEQEIVEYHKKYNEEYREENREAIAKQKKEYIEENREAIAKNQKKYNEEHKEAIAKQKKEWYEANREAITDYKKNYYEENKEKFNCECGGKFTLQNKGQHEKTKKHQQFLQQQ
jgi:post-segregation antitoxin (ccd killing protein)